MSRLCLSSIPSSVEVSVFKYQPGVQTPVEQLHNYRISSRGGAITGSLNQMEERRGENVSGSVDIAAGGRWMNIVRFSSVAFLRLITWVFRENRLDSFCGFRRFDPDTTVRLHQPSSCAVCNFHVRIFPTLCNQVYKKCEMSECVG